MNDKDQKPGLSAHPLKELRAENARLKERVAALVKIKNAAADVGVLWREYTSQETYGEHLRAGIEPDDFAAWEEAHAVLREAVREMPASDKPIDAHAPLATARSDERAMVLAEVRAWHLSEIERIDFVARSREDCFPYLDVSDRLLIASHEAAIRAFASKCLAAGATAPNESGDKR